MEVVAVRWEWCSGTARWWSPVILTPCEPKRLRFNANHCTLLEHQSHTHTHTHTGEVNNCLAHNAHTVFTSFFPPPPSSLASSLSSSLLLLHLSSKSWPHSFFVCSPPLNPLFVTSPTSFSLPFVSLSFLPSAVILFSPPLLLSPPLRCDLIPVDRVSFLCCN